MTERLLLIDDDDSFREVMTFHLQEEGYAVSAAAGGEEGLRLFEQQPFAVVITDLKMPGMDGMALTQAVLKRAPDTLVIVITAFGDIESAVA
ncbi:MAG: response regulator, partial [Alphaproteobacteria bacterium]